MGSFDSIVSAIYRGEGEIAVAASGEGKGGAGVSIDELNRAAGHDGAAGIGDATSDPTGVSLSAHDWAGEEGQTKE